MNCERVSEILPLYADRDLESREATKVAQHLESCEACRERLALDRKLGLALAELPAPPEAAAMALELQRRVMGEARRPHRQPVWRNLGATANATIAFVVVGLLVLGTIMLSQSLPSLRLVEPASPSPERQTPNPSPSVATPEAGPAGKAVRAKGLAVYHLLSWGARGSKDGQFDYPADIAVDRAGNVYVPDFNNNRVQKFDTDGHFLLSWGSKGSGDGQFNNPTAVAVDRYGNVYVVDQGNHRVQKFSPDGTFLLKFGSEGQGNGQFMSPEGIAADSPAFGGIGVVYVADSALHRVQLFTDGGHFVASWGSQGQGDGQFDYPVGVATNIRGEVLVTDGNNNRIQKFAADGKFLGKWGSSGTGDGQFNFPVGIAVDVTGEIYVVDKNNFRIQKFDAAGRFLGWWGAGGFDDGQFDRPLGVGIDTDGNVYVAEYHNYRVQKFAELPRPARPTPAPTSTPQPTVIPIEQQRASIRGYLEQQYRPGVDAEKLAKGLSEAMVSAGLEVRALGVPPAAGGVPMVLAAYSPRYPDYLQGTSFFWWEGGRLRQQDYPVQDSANPGGSLGEFGMVPVFMAAKQQVKNGQVELGLVYDLNAMSSGRPLEVYRLMRLENGQWQTVWDGRKDGDKLWSVPHTKVSFVASSTGLGDDVLAVIALRYSSPLNDGKNFFGEGNAGPHRWFDDLWVRNGDRYQRISSKIEPSAYATLVEFVYRLSQGDEAGAGWLVLDPNLVLRAKDFGLDRPSSKPEEIWLAAGSVGTGPISIGRGPAITLYFDERGGEWLIKDIVATQPSPTPSPSPTWSMALTPRAGS